jgi:hypothetical protein
MASDVVEEKKVVTRKKKDYVPQVWVDAPGAWEDLEFEKEFANTAEVRVAIKANGEPGRYRIIAICDEFVLKSETIVKTTIEEV